MQQKTEAGRKEYFSKKINKLRDINKRIIQSQSQKPACYLINFKYLKEKK